MSRLHLMVRWGFLGWECSLDSGTRSKESKHSPSQSRDRRSVGENPPPYERILGEGKLEGSVRTVILKV